MYARFVNMKMILPSYYYKYATRSLLACNGILGRCHEMCTRGRRRKLVFKCEFKIVLEHVQVGEKAEDQTNVSFEHDIYG